jgi:hypothetical protein
MAGDSGFAKIQICSGNFANAQRTLDARRRRPYFVRMICNRRRLLGSSLHAVLAAFLILCLTLAPLCAARCAVQSCSPVSSEGSAGGCHHSSGHSSSSTTFAVDSAKLCTTTQLLFTAPSSEDSSSFPSLASLSFFVPVHLNAAVPCFVVSGISGLLDRSPLFPDPSLSSHPLRI